MRRWRTLFLILVLVSIGALAFTLFGDLPAPDTLITRSSPDTTKIFDRNGRLLYEVLDPRAGRRTRVALDELPLNLRHAVIAVEDANFYSNPGVDIAGVARALVQNLFAGDIVSGASTLTQQLARELLLSKEERATRSVTRKLREMVLALRLTQTYSKDQILEMYLNEVYFGQLAYGAEAAARVYFGKPARELDLAESALLAGLIQSPAAYNPLVNLDAARERQNIVLGLMVKNGYITDAQAQLARNETLNLKGLAHQTDLHAPHFVTYVRNWLEEQYGAEAVNHGGMRVVTTLDLDLQEQAEAIIRTRLADLARRTREENAPDYNVHDAALVALEPRTGEILAMVGSADYFDAGIEGAVNVALSNRQPGSAVKPITYATALTRGLTPATVFTDVPTTFLTRENEPYAPQNYDRVWHGPISLRQALATSSNLVAVKVLDTVGLEAMIDTAKRLGITTFNDSDRFGLALTLGGGEVKLLDLTAAYAAFANDGTKVEPVAILQIDNQPADSPGTRSAPAAITPQVAYLITSILSDDKARIPAFGEDSVLKLSRPAAAKTGTTTDFRDNWTVGYTPDLAVGVWVGNANNEPMYKTSGITGAAPIWHDFMEEALSNKPVQDFTRPEGIVQAQVCETSGLLATDLCPRRRSEIFVAGSEPLTYDDSYRAFAIDSATGLAWTTGCAGQRLERVFWLVPPDAQDWGYKQGIPEPPALDCLNRPVADAARPANVISPGTLAPIIITNPAPNSIYQLSPQIPLAFQQVELTARLNANLAPGRVSLVLDGKTIATFSRAPYRALWQLTRGEHQLKAVATDAGGTSIESESVKFLVTDE